MHCIALNYQLKLMNDEQAKEIRIAGLMYVCMCACKYLRIHVRIHMHMHTYIFVSQGRRQ